MVTHILGGGNQVADLLANHGVSLTYIFYCQDVPAFSLDSFKTSWAGLTLEFLDLGSHGLVPSLLYFFC